MSGNKKRLLLMMGLIIVITIPVTKMVSQNTAENKEQTNNNKVVRDEVTQAIESAIYNQADFFATTALVPYPTATARNQLLAVVKRYPKEPSVYKQLSQLEIELGNKDAAEKALLNYVSLSENSQTTLTELANFYQEQAEFVNQADTLNKMLDLAPDEERPDILDELVALADKHKIDKYLGAKFYKEVASRHPDNLEILEKYLDKLVTDKEYKTALKIVDSYRQNIADKDQYFLKKQVDILLETDDWQAAKELYIKNFDPFWPDNIKQSFYYEVLSDNDQLRAYGQELRAKFQKDPSSFDFAIRLIDYCNYNSEQDLSSYVFYKLEESRSQNNIAWTSKELTILARLALKKGEAERASRYVYTLYNQGELKPGSELRGQLLYQLFEIVMDSQNQRLPVTTGNLKFYQEVANADRNPGVIGGILSLIFSDSKPQEKFAEAETNAIHHFNQAAAYRIFLTYKKEFPTSPQLAQMYLDIIRFYTEKGDTDIADKTLQDFENRYKKAEKFPEVAMKLADVYILNKDREKELAVYQQILDYLGKNARTGRLLKTVKHKEVNQNSYNEDDEEKQTTIEPPMSEPTKVAPTTEFVELNPGLKITQPKSDNAEYYYYEEAQSFEDYLVEPQKIDYSTVLNRYIFALDKENRTKEIIELFNREIKKYPKESGLYEQLLQWLGQTNLVEDQLAIYQKAIKQFPTTLWHDRLARWLISKERYQEFASYSQDLVSKFDDKEIEDYLNKFVTDYRQYSKFYDGLYFSLYQKAHNRFPQNHQFVRGLLDYYVVHKQWDNWQALIGRYYFIWPEVRNEYLSYLSKNDQLRKYLADAQNKLVNSTDINNLLPYKLFRADAAIWLCNYEEAIDAYRELNRLYPGNQDFAQQLVGLTRSFGQVQRKFLTEATNVQIKQVSLRPGLSGDRVIAGELYAETNDYQKAKIEWSKLLELGKDKQTYLDTATIFWDYFQYDDALKVIEALRKQKQDNTLLAFEMGAILEAKHQSNSAVAEYIKGIAKDNEQYSKCRKRLATLYGREKLTAEIEKTFSQELARTKNSDELVLGYVEVLELAEKKDLASNLLKKAIYQTKSMGFLKKARSFFREMEDQDSEIATIKQCLKYSRSYKEDISCRLQLISLHREREEKQQVIKNLQFLIAKYPFNYGVIDEVVSNYWHLGLTKQAINTLNQAIKNSRGQFRYQLTQRLAQRELELNNTKTAQNLLEKLFEEDKLDSQVLETLTNLYIRTENKKALEKALAEGLKAVESQDMHIRDLRLEIAYFRQRMIDKFTQIKDYNAAIKQHIEIINRNPEDYYKLDLAIEYTEKYGGGDELAAYYKKVFEQAYKNYRWAVVLARISKSKGDLETAIKYYQAAIDNQPTKAELYSSLAEIYKEKEDLTLAISTVNKAIELSNYEVVYVKQAIELLDLAGRESESLALKSKIPIEKNKENIQNNQNKVASGFDQAEQLRNTNEKEAINLYRKAFEALLADPYKASEINSYKLQNYIEVVHKEDSLSKILQSFLQLRDKLVKEIQKENSYDAAKARSLLEIIDGVLPSSIANIAENSATGDELNELYKTLTSLINAEVVKANSNSSLQLVENIILSTKFLDLQEYILLTQLRTGYNKGVNYQDRFGKIINFYELSGNYQKALKLLEKETEIPKAFDLIYLQQIVKFSSLLGDTKTELKALHRYFQENKSNPDAENDPLVERYLTLLYQGDKNDQQKLVDLTKTHSVYQKQLINFLIAKNEKTLVHQAIKATKSDKLWQDSYNAEISLQLEDYNEQNKQYFDHSLNFQKVGNLIKIKANEKNQLVGDKWFEMANKYGQWLYKTSIKTITADRLLPANIERRPQDALEQQKLGHWYLAQKNTEKALSYLLNAQEMGANSAEILADIGSAYFLKGDKEKALNYWLKILNKDETNVNQLWLSTLKKHGLVEKAREELKNKLIENKDEKTPEEIKSYLYLLANSFKEEGGKLNSNQAKAQASFLLNLSKLETSTTPEIIIREQLVAIEYLAPFYELMIENSSRISKIDVDYEYFNRAKLAKDLSLLEEELDHNKIFQSKEPNATQYQWQKEYLHLLLSQNKNDAALKLTQEIEKSLANKYLRPEWLRVAKIQLMLRKGQIQQAWEKLLHYTKIEVQKDIKTIDVPSQTRLQQALKLLADRDLEKDKLLKAYYSRCLALEQYTLPNLIGLADVVYRSGDIDLGNKLLQLTLNFVDSYKQAKAAKELLNLEIIKTYRVSEKYIITPPVVYGDETGFSSFNVGEAIAEIATKYGQYNLAIEQRKQLKIYAGEINSIELARLFAANNQVKEAMIELVNFISDRKVSRKNRWLAVSLIPTIAKTNRELWAVTEKVIDKEFKLAIEATRLASVGEFSAAIKLINGQFNTVEMKFFQAILERKNNNFKTALALINQIPYDCKPYDFLHETSALRQRIYLYSITNAPEAVLELAKKDSQLQQYFSNYYSTENLLGMGKNSSSGNLQLLKAIERNQEYKTTLDLLALSANAAESLGDFELAIRFLKAMQPITNKEVEAKLQKRIDDLTYQKEAKSKNSQKVETSSLSR